jgi:signal transduction histidine kinase
MREPDAPPPAPAPGMPLDLRPVAALVARGFASTTEATQAILALASAQLGLRSTFLTCIAPADGRSHILAAHNEPGGSDIVAGVALPLDDSFCGIIIAAGGHYPLPIPDARHDPASRTRRAVAAFPTVGSVIGVPIVLSDGTVFGTLCAVDPDPQPLTGAQADLLIVLARLIATQLERDRQAAARLEAEAARIEAEAARLAAEKERDALLAALAHDLKTPLTATRGLAQLLLLATERGRPPTAEVLAQRLAQIVAAADRATALVDGQLDLARAHFGRPLALAPGPTDLVALARSVAAEQAPLAARHHVRVVTDRPDRFVPIDAPQIERVLTNLVSNAIKYSPDGGDVTLTLGPGTLADAPCAVLAVADGGIGIPAGDLPQIGEPFRRGANVLGQIAGTGLGLASARQIVEAHGGTLAIASTEGAGTTVTIRLPLPVAAG